MTFASDNVPFGEKNFKEIAFDNLFIGKGGFGHVYGPCTWKNRSYAIKKHMFDPGTAKDVIEKNLKACDKWKSLNHEHLITVYELCLDSLTLYVFMEYAAGGSLKKVLWQRTSDLPLEIMVDWAKQIVEGMAYLHQVKIVHRDLKSPNSKFYTSLILNIALKEWINQLWGCDHDGR